MEEFESILKEAYKDVSNIFGDDDKGWINLSVSSTASQNVLDDAKRKEAVQKSRYYATIDPLGKQAIRLWTDYTFGTGLNWSTEDDATTKALTAFWDNPANAPILSSRGQRKCSDKLLIDGEVFFALFLGTKGQATLRTIDPLEITEIITDPDDVEDERYYKREWINTQNQSQTGYYRSFGNEKNEEAKDSLGATVKSNQDALVYHLAYNSIGQRGLPLLLPALDWIKLYRQFLASRVAVMLALARFAWKVKVQGGQTAVTAAKTVYNDQKPAPGSVAIENLGADLQPIRTDSGASQAYQDGRMLKLQVSAATGWPEQYFGDISIGNLATAKTVELPVMKMCQGYQAVWKGGFNDINQVVLEHAGVAEDKRYVDMDFPAISPEDAGQIAESLAAIIPQFPELANSRDVMQQALLAIGVDDINSALDELDKAQKESAGDVNVKLAKALRDFKEVIQNDGHKVPQVSRQ